MLARSALVVLVGVVGSLPVLAASRTACAAPKGNAVPAANRVNMHDQPLFEALCGKGNDAVASGRRGCTRCPSYTLGGADEPAAPAPPGAKREVIAWPEFQVSGAFTHPGAREQLIVIAAAPCEGHVNNYGGSLLLDRSQPTPKIVEYDRGFVPSSCKAHALSDGRSALLCASGFTQSGILEQSLTVRDFSEPWDDRVDHALFTLESDESNVCSTASDSDQGPFSMSSLKDYGWTDTDHDGRVDVTATIQYVTFPMAGPLRKHCDDLDAFWASAHKTAQLAFEADRTGLWLANDATKAALRESAGLNTGAP